MTGYGPLTMFWIIKTAIGLAVLGVVGYGLFFMDFGGKSPAAHVMDIWYAPVVQQKVQLVRGEVEAELQERLTEAAESKVSSKLRDGLASQEELAEEDRKVLNDLIGRASKAR